MAGIYQRVREALQRLLTRWKERMERHPRWARVLRIVKTAGFRWLWHGGPRLAAALAFYTAISLAPLLTIVVTIIGFIYGEEAARGHLIDEIENLTDRQAAAFIQTLIADAGEVSRGVTSSLISIGVLIWGSTRLFFQMQESLNVIWDARDREGVAIVMAARQRLIAFSMTIVMAFLLLVSLLLNAALSYVSSSVRVTLPGQDWIWSLANHMISLLMIWGLFTAIYKVLPNRPVPWMKAMIGAFVAALLFSIGKEFMGMYLANQESVQGAAGALMAVLIWVYFSAQIFYFGAELSKAVMDIRYEEAERKPAEDSAAKEEVSPPEETGEVGKS